MSLMRHLASTSVVFSERFDAGIKMTAPSLSTWDLKNLPGWLACPNKTRLFSRELTRTSASANGFVAGLLGRNEVGE